MAAILVLAARGTLLELAAGARGERFHWAHVTDAQGDARSTYSTRLDDAGDVLIVSYSETEDDALMATTMLLVGVLSLLLIATGAVLSYRLAGRALRPVHRVASLARTISERDLHQRVDGGTPPDELGELVATFNGMLARLESAFDAMRWFTADASHELRAPIAVMRLELERALDRVRTAEEYHAIVDQLLVLTRADAGMLRPGLQPLDVTDLLQEAVARWAPAAAQERVFIELAVAAAPGSIPGDAAPLRRVVDNLLDNAIRHAPAGSAVRVEASRTRSGLDLEVADQGPGVAPELRPRLFSALAAPTAPAPAPARESGWGSRSVPPSRAPTAVGWSTWTAPERARCSGCTCRTSPQPAPSEVRRVAAARGEPPSRESGAGRQGCTEAPRGIGGVWGEWGAGVQARPQLGGVGRQRTRRW